MAEQKLTTVAEETGFRATGRTDEVERLCEAFAAQWPEAVKSLEYGRSAEGGRCSRSSCRVPIRGKCRCS